ncbi:MAG TPA: DUF3127 domain-containing protein [Bacteroidales bacterium]|nr:DUF3127 domain-containing protein [Bacteroidales bacterium]HOH21979.1 DUF3127 domain-containing protein [Bacteroidales bacterium]HPB57243.1 DUF3127 domain-containing protein [Bacteroidales bacterium]HPZ03490.1 DUF3127 domain-containing protein [Bacteroidales bacterium]HQB74900.1 DUF3127 domain-containing protein [Bacteroidales bacterium]
MEISGKLLMKLPLQSGVGKTGNAWKKQEFVIETQEAYPKKVCIQLWGDKVDDLDPIQIGDVITVSINVESREFNGKWYTDVRAWKIERAGGETAAPGYTQPESAPSYPEDSLPDASGTFSDESYDSLPF